MFNSSNSNFISGKVDLASLKILGGSVVGLSAYWSFHKVIISFIRVVQINIEGELLVGCGDGELVMVVEGAVKKPPPGRVTFPTQVQQMVIVIC